MARIGTDWLCFVRKTAFKVRDSFDVSRSLASISEPFVLAVRFAADCPSLNCSFMVELIKNDRN